jgi:TonB family protein
MSEPDSERSHASPSSESRRIGAESVSGPGHKSGFESDLAQLAAKFASHSGGNLAADLSLDLALEVVLNEIVEQACLATRATGAAVLLWRDGEMVCRASSGASAPELGARLGGESGLTADCIKTRQVQRCEDAQTDPRADVEASRRLGVRSVMILPLMRSGELAGLLEVFSSRPGVFGVRDEVTLEALAQRILKNLERASQPLGAADRGAVAMPASPISATQVVGSQAASRMVKEESAKEKSAAEDWVNQEVDQGALGRSPRTALDVVTFILGLTVLGCAVLLSAMVGLRLGWLKTTTTRRQVERHSATTTSDPKTAISVGSTSALGGAGKSLSAGDKNNAVATPPPARSADPVPAGSLLVYENGKEVFRLTPSREGQPKSATSINSTGVQPASEVEPTGILKVSPEAAEGSVLHRVEPDYPEGARQQKVQGSVQLDVHVDREGAVQEVKWLSGQRLLADAAIAAVKQWRFKPHLVKGQPVEIQTTVTLNFRLEQ